MRWIERSLKGPYTLIGELKEGVVTLYIEHPEGQKIIQRKFISSMEQQDVTIDDIEHFFATKIERIIAKTKDQLKLFCHNTK